MTMTRLIRTLALVLIIGLTLLPAGLQLSRIITGHSGETLDENRALEDWPKWAEAQNRPAKYTANISSFFNDHFGGRAMAIRIRNKIFRIVGDNSVSVLRGQTKGWYYLNDGVLWDSYTGRRGFSERDKTMWLSEIKTLQLAAQDAGAVFAAIIPPDKARIYPEHAPERFGTPSENRFVTALYDSANSEKTGLINIEPALLRAKAQGPVFTKTDTHWTVRGAFVAYDKVMDYYGAQGLKVPRLKDTDLRNIQLEAFSGDLAQLMGLKDNISESFKDKSAPPLQTEFSCKVIEDASVLNADWQTKVYQNEASSETVLVIIGDSFSNVLVPLFKHSFDQIIVVHHRMGKFNLDAAMSYNPDAVLFAPVERTAVKMRNFAKP